MKDVQTPYPVHIKKNLATKEQHRATKRDKKGHEKREMKHTANECNSINHVHELLYDRFLTVDVIFYPLYPSMEGYIGCCFFLCPVTDIIGDGGTDRRET